MRRILIKALAVALGACAALLVAMTSQRLSEAARPTVEHWASAVSGLEIRLGRLTVVALPPGIVVQEVTVRSASLGPQVYLRADTVRMRPGLWPLVYGRFTLKQVAIEGLDVQAELASMPTTQGNQQASAFGLPIDIRQLSVRDAAIHCKVGDSALDAFGLNLEVNPTSWRSRSLALSLVGGTVRWPQLNKDRPAMPFGLHLAGQLTGSLAQPKAIVLDLAHVEAGGNQADISGEILFSSPQPELRLGIVANSSFADLAIFYPPLAVWRGKAGVDIELRGTPSFPKLVGTLRLKGLSGPRHPALGDLCATGQLNWPMRDNSHSQRASSRVPQAQRTISLERVVYHLPDKAKAGMITGSGHLSLDTWELSGAAARLHDVSWPALSTALGIATGPLKVACSGTVQAHGFWHASSLAQAQIDWQCQDFAVGPKARAKQLQPIVALRHINLHGSATLTPNEIVLPALKMTSDAGTVLVSGKVAKSSASYSYDLGIQTPKLMLAAIGPLAGVPYSGEASVDGHLSGTLNKPNFTTQLKSQGLKVGPICVGDGSAQLRYEDAQLHFDEVTIVRRTGTLDGSGTIVFGSPQATLSAHLMVHGVDAQELATSLALPEGIARTFDARVWGGVRLFGPLSRPLGHALIKTPQLAVDTFALGPAELALRFAKEHSPVAARLTVSPPGGEIDANFELFDGRLFKLELVGRHLSLALMPALARNELQGELELTARLEGPLQSPAGSISFDVTPLRLGTVLLGGAHGLLRIRDHVGAIEASFLAGSVHAKGEVQLRKNFALRLLGKLDQLAWQPLWTLPWLAMPATFRDIDLTTSGTFAIAGSAIDLAHASARLDLTQMDLAWHGLAAHLIAPTTFSLVKSRLALSALTLRGPTLSATLSGSTPVGSAADGNTPIALNLAMRGDLSVVQALSGDIDAARGPIRINGTLGGVWARPSLMGEAEVHGASLRWQRSDRPLEQLNLRAVFSGRAVAITQGSAKLGRGTLKLVGEATPGKGTWSDPDGNMSLRLTLSHVPLSPLSDLDATLSGGLELGGSRSGRTLHGDLRLESLRYTARIDLDRLIPKRADPPLRAPMLAGLPPFRLGVHLSAPNNVIISSNVLESELATELTLTGTTERIGLLGSATPLWARARWRNNVFTINRASIDFVDEFRIAPQFSVRAHTQACHMEAEVLVEGSVDGYNVVPTGRDERGTVDPQDVLACLQLGLRLRDFDGNQKNGATVGDALSSGIDALWTVSGLDDKVRKLLPIGVDELRLTSGWSSIGQRTTARVLVGKELGRKLALRYSRSLDEYNDQAFSLDYRLAERATMQGNWLSTRDVPIGDFGVDLRLHWELH